MSVLPDASVEPFGARGDHVVVGGRPVGWALTLVPAAGEAGGSFRYAGPSRPIDRARGPSSDPERSRVEAARRARSKVRRYCAANRLNRLGTLTYAGDGNHDSGLLREHVGVFFRRLRSGVGREFPYLWVPEWHKTGHGLHVHFAVGRFLARSLIDDAWGRGFVHIKLLGDLPVGSGPLAEARKAAGYLSKYVGKSFEDGQRVPGMHRYEVAQGYQPATQAVYGRTAEEAIGRASEVMGAPPVVRWSSGEVEGWQGPPAVWVQWAG